MAGPAPTTLTNYKDRSAGPVHSSGWLFAGRWPFRVVRLVTNLAEVVQHRVSPREVKRLYGLVVRIPHLATGNTPL